MSGVEDWESWARRMVQSEWKEDFIFRVRFVHSFESRSESFDTLSYLKLKEES